MPGGCGRQENAKVTPQESQRATKTPVSVVSTKADCGLQAGISLARSKLLHRLLPAKGLPPNPKSVNAL